MNDTRNRSQGSAKTSSIKAVCCVQYKNTCVGRGAPHTSVINALKQRSKAAFIMVNMASVLPGVGAFAVVAIAFQGTAIASSLSAPLLSHPSSGVAELPVGHSITQENGQADGSGGSSQATPVTLIFVNPLAGQDATGDGSQRSPLRTLTHALERASVGTTIMLAPGIYSTDTGERFPIRLKRGVTVYGNPSTQGDGILIRGGGDFVSLTATRQNIAILGADQATLTGVTVTNPNPRGYGVWVESSSPHILDNTLTGNLHDGVSVNGTSAPLIQRNHFVQNGANGVTVFGRSQPRIQDNVFENTGYGINLGDSATPVIVNNRIVNNRSGVVAQEQSRPVLRNNVIENNEQNGVVAIAQAQPDLGILSDPGNNQFSGNGQFAINAQVADFPVIAAGNQIDPSHIVGTVDFEAQQSSSAPLTSAPSPVSPVPVTAVSPNTTGDTDTHADRITTAPPSTENAVERIPQTSLSSENATTSENATELIPSTPLSAENATELIPITTSPPASQPASSLRADPLIPAEPLSSENATELIPIQLPSPMGANLRSEHDSPTLPTVSVPASIDSSSDSSSTVQRSGNQQSGHQQSANTQPDSQVEAPIPTQLPALVVPQTLSPPTEESSDTPSPIQAEPPNQSSSTIPMPVRIVRSPGTSTTPFPRPTDLHASASVRMGNDALPIDEFITPESRLSEQSSSTRGHQPEQTTLPPTLSIPQDAESQETEQSNEPDTETGSVAIHVNNPDALSRSSQRLIRPALHRTSSPTEASTPTEDSLSVNQPAVVATSASLPASVLPTSVSESIETESIPIQVIDPPEPAAPEQPNAQALLVNPAAMSRTMASATQSSGTSSGTEPARLINPAAASVSSSVNQAVNQTVAIAPQYTLPQRNENLLPVPSADVPYGHVGDVTRVSVGENPLSSRLGITNTRASLRYRVVVDGQGQSMDDVRAVSPGAFQTWLNGRSLIQVGAFANLENANEVAELLAIRGIQAEIQPMQ